MTLISTQAAAETLPLATQLPVRQDDPISLLFMLKVMLITALLLAATYLALRLYAQKNGRIVNRAISPDLSCTAALRLSTRTKVYLIKTPTADVLLSEGQAGTTMVVLPPGSSQAEALLTDEQPSL